MPRRGLSCRRRDTAACARAVRDRVIPSDIADDRWFRLANCCFRSAICEIFNGPTRQRPGPLVSMVPAVMATPVMAAPMVTTEMMATTPEQRCRLVIVVGSRPRVMVPQPVMMVARPIMMVPPVVPVVLHFDGIAGPQPLAGRVLPVSRSAQRICMGNGREQQDQHGKAPGKRHRMSATTHVQSSPTECPAPV